MNAVNHFSSIVALPLSPQLEYLSQFKKAFVQEIISYVKVSCLERNNITGSSVCKICKYLMKDLRNESSHSRDHIGVKFFDTRVSQYSRKHFSLPLHSQEIHPLWFCLVLLFSCYDHC